MAMNDRCDLCGLRQHRFGFPDDGLGHRPSSVACSNSIIGLIEDAYAITLTPHIAQTISRLAVYAESTRARAEEPSATQEPETA